METCGWNEGPDRSVFLASAVCGNISENCWIRSLQLKGWYSGECARCLPTSPHGTPSLGGGGPAPWHQTAPPHGSPGGPSAGLRVRLLAARLAGCCRIVKPSLQGRGCARPTSTLGRGAGAQTRGTHGGEARGRSPVLESPRWCLARGGRRPRPGR